MNRSGCPPTIDSLRTLCLVASREILANFSELQALTLAGAAGRGYPPQPGRPGPLAGRQPGTADAGDATTRHGRSAAPSLPMTPPGRCGLRSISLPPSSKAWPRLSHSFWTNLRRSGQPCRSTWSL